jgi:hypothetical protein
VADSIRQRILTALDTRLKTIRTSAGYETELGLNVYEWRVIDLQEMELPGLIWKDYAVGEAEPATIMGDESLTEQTMDIDINIKVQDGQDTASTIRKAIADVQKAIGTDETWGGLALMTSDNGNETERDQEDRITGNVTMRIGITYHTTRWNAYA